MSSVKMSRNFWPFLFIFKNAFMLILKQRIISLTAKGKTTLPRGEDTEKQYQLLLQISKKKQLTTDERNTNGEMHSGWWPWSMVINWHVLKHFLRSSLFRSQALFLLFLIFITLRDHSGAMLSKQQSRTEVIGTAGWKDKLCTGISCHSGDCDRKALKCR